VQVLEDEVNTAASFISRQHRRTICSVNLRIDRSDIHRRGSVLGDRPLVSSAADGADVEGQPEREDESDDVDGQTDLYGCPRLGGQVVIKRGTTSTVAPT